MKKVILAFIAVAALTPAPSEAALIHYTAVLNGASENPSNLSLGTGFAEVFFDDAANTLRVVVDFAGLTGPNTAAHIHCCVAPPGNAGVATATPTFPGFPPGAAGHYDATFDTTLASTYRAGFITSPGPSGGGGTVAGAEAALGVGLAAGQAYLNIHTGTYPGGEIRGFLAVPEPTSLSLVGLGIAGAMLLRRRQRS